MKIFKYDLSKVTNGEVTVEIPKGAEILTARIQNGSPMVWAKINPEMPAESKKFYIVPTGEDTPTKATEYIDTIETKSGLIFHVYHEREKPAKKAKV